MAFVETERADVDRVGGRQDRVPPAGRHVHLRRTSEERGNRRHPGITRVPDGQGFTAEEGPAELVLHIAGDPVEIIPTLLGGLRVRRRGDIRRVLPGRGHRQRTAAEVFVIPPDQESFLDLLPVMFERKRHAITSIPH